METPLSSASFHILFALAMGAKHGYAIMREARRISNESFDMGPATLYTNIQRLLACGWIEEAEPAEGDGRRRVYRLTAEGNSALEIELKRMEDIVRTSRKLRLFQAGSSS